MVCCQPLALRFKEIDFYYLSHDLSLLFFNDLPGETGRNFGAGMSGGIAYIFDPNDEFPARCNMGLVDLEKVEDEEEKEDLKKYIEEHIAFTGSEVGQEMLKNWDENVTKFVKVGLK